MHGAKANRRSFKFNLKKKKKITIWFCPHSKSTRNYWTVKPAHCLFREHGGTETPLTGWRSRNTEPQALGAKHQRSLTRAPPPSPPADPLVPSLTWLPNNSRLSTVLAASPSIPSGPSSLPHPNPRWVSTCESRRPREAPPARLTSRILLWPLCANSLNKSGK